MRSLSERYDRLQSRADELAGVDPEGMSAVHVRTVDVMTELLEMGEKLSTGDTPAPLRALIGMIRRLRGEMLRQIAGVPPASIRAFMADLIAQMQSIVDTADAGENGQGGQGGDDDHHDDERRGIA